MKRLRTPALGLLSALLLSACTLVPTDPSPRVVDSADVPSGLLNGAESKQSATVSLWFFDGQDRLVKRSARIQAPLTISVLIAQLALRVPRGLSTALPPKLVMSRAVIRGAEATVVFTAGFQSGNAVSVRATMQQLAATLRDNYGISTLNVTDAATGRTFTIDAPTP
jgi:hypothetical protein